MTRRVTARIRDLARRSPLAAWGLGVVGALVLVAILAPVLAPYAPTATSGGPLSGPSARHLLGTDDIGEDVLSQLIWGARVSLFIAVPAAALNVAVATLVGAGAGLLGGLADLVVVRILDGLLAVPGLPLIILAGSLVGTSSVAIILIIGLTGWPVLARIVRSQVLSLRQRPFVSAARGLGASPAYVLRRHMIPGLAPVLVAGFVQWAGTAVLLESGLALLGLGNPVTVSWGSMLNRALSAPAIYSNAAWLWWVLPPALAVTAAVLGFAFIGMGLEPVFNPRTARADAAGSTRPAMAPRDGA